MDRGLLGYSPWGQMPLGSPREGKSSVYAHLRGVGWGEAAER